MSEKIRKAPSVWQLKDLLYHSQSTQTCIDGKWIPARPIGDDSLRNRFCCAWLVFTGKADVVKWPNNQ